MPLFRAFRVHIAPNATAFYLPVVLVCPRQKISLSNGLRNALDVHLEMIKKDRRMLEDQFVAGIFSRTSGPAHPGQAAILTNGSGSDGSEDAMEPH